MAVITIKELLEAECSFWSSDQTLESKNETLHL